MLAMVMLLLLLRQRTGQISALVDHLATPAATAYVHACGYTYVLCDA
jgi:hypothetical protein